MRHQILVLGVVTLVLAGCGKPAGVDGTLTDDWRAVAAPTGFTPVAETCHAAGFVDVGYRSAYEQVDCAKNHRAETISVETYPPEAAMGTAPPEKGSPDAEAAYATCSARATTFVGGPWHTGRLWLGVVNPSPAAWTGGARWYRCDLLEISSVEDDGDLVARTGSLRDSLAAAGSPLTLACYGVLVNATGAIDAMPAKPCTEAHNAEFVGVWTAPAEAKYPKADADWATFHKGCRALIATYAAVPNDKNLEFRTGVVSLPGGEDVWAAGDRAVRCYLWVAGASFTSTVKGKGDKTLPIQYQ